MPDVFLVVYQHPTLVLEYSFVVALEVGAIDAPCLPVTGGESACVVTCYEGVEEGCRGFGSLEDGIAGSGRSYARHTPFARLESVDQGCKAFVAGETCGAAQGNASAQDGTLQEVHHVDGLVSDGLVVQLAVLDDVLVGTVVVGLARLDVLVEILLEEFAAGTCKVRVGAQVVADVVDAVLISGVGLLRCCDGWLQGCQLSVEGVHRSDGSGLAQLC